MDLIDMGGRIYDPALQHFLTADPIVHTYANMQAYNRYGYALNDPLRVRTLPTVYEADDGSGDASNQATGNDTVEYRRPAA